MVFAHVCIIIFICTCCFFPVHKMAINGSGYEINNNDFFVDYDVIMGYNGESYSFNNHSNNATHLDGRTKEVVISFLFLELILMTSTLCANGLVLIAFINNRHLRINVTNFYLLQLSLANFLMGIVSILNIWSILDPKSFSNDYACVSRYASTLVVCGYSSLSLLAISYDRFVAIAGPLYYRARICKRRVFIHCVLIYSIPSLLFLILPFIWRDSLDNNEYCSMTNIFRQSYLAFIVIPFYLIITTILTLLFLITVYLNRRRMHTIKKLVATMPFNWKRNSAQKRSIRLTRTSGFVLASFLSCWLPYFIILMAQVYGGIQNESVELASNIAFLPILFNCALTPMLYVYRLSTFRASIKKMFCKDQYLQEMQEYETTRLLQRRNAIRHIRDTYDSVTTVMDSGLFTSALGVDSEFESEAEISDIPVYDTVFPGICNFKRRKSSTGSLFSERNESNEYEQKYDNRHLSPHISLQKPQNGFINVVNKNYDFISGAPSVIEDNLPRRHSSPFRKPSLQTIPQKEILNLQPPSPDSDRNRRGSSPEFGRETPSIGISPSFAEQLAVHPTNQQTATPRRGSFDLSDNAGFSRRTSFSSNMSTMPSGLQDIPEGKVIKTPDFIENQDSVIHGHNFSSSPGQIRRVSSPETSQFGADPDVLEGTGRRISSPHLRSYNIQNKTRSQLHPTDVNNVTQPEKHTNLNIMRGRSNTVADTRVYTPHSDTNRKASLQYPIPSIVVNEDKTNNKQQNMFTTYNNFETNTDPLSENYPPNLSESENGTEQILRNNGNADGVKKIESWPVLNTYTGREHTTSSESSCDNLLNSHDSFYTGSGAAIHNRRKSSLLHEITAPIARRLNAIFKHVDNNSEASDSTDTLSPSKQTHSKKLRDRLLHRRNSHYNNTDSSTSCEWDSPSNRANPSTRRRQSIEKENFFSTNTPFYKLDRALVDIVQEDPTVVLELLEDLEELLQDDQQLSSLVIRDIKQRAEQAILLSQQKAKKRTSSLRRLFLGSNDVTLDLLAKPNMEETTRRQTVCTSYGLNQSGANGGQSKPHNEAVYTIPYKGSMRRKQRSLAYIFDTNRNQSPQNQRKSQSVNDNLRLSDNPIQNGGLHLENGNNAKNGSSNWWKRRFSFDKRNENQSNARKTDINIPLVIVSDASKAQDTCDNEHWTHHKPVAKCVRIPMAETDQAKSDQILFT